MASKPNGAIIWEGRSRYDGRPMAAIVTWKSENGKTGDMAQVWFIPKAPTSEIKSVCGKCPLSGACYVVMYQGPLGVWKAYRAGRYPKWDRLPINKPVRIGAWGDPGSIPEDILEFIISRCSHGHTMYTHSHHTLGRLSPTLVNYGMISVETKEQATKYQSLGYRTFRVTKHGDSLLKGEIWCSYPKVQCRGCLLCGNRGKKSIAIPVHGYRAGNFKEG